MSDVRDYQVDHLLLLVGSNPVPNAVAGKLLTRPGGTITLIHSADGLYLAQRLKSWFVNTGYSDKNIGFTQVEESNATLINERLVNDYFADSRRPSSYPRRAAYFAQEGGITSTSLF